jgi:hypothetical protein
MGNLEKKKLDFIFNKILLKFYNTVRNTTNYPMASDLFREEIQMYVCITVALEFKVLLSKIFLLHFKDIDNKLLIHTVIRFLLVSSTQKINYKLNLGHSNSKLKNSINWLYKEFQFHDIYSFNIILQSLAMSKVTVIQNRQYSLCVSLIENYVIKLSNIILYELFPDKLQSRQILLKFYAVDSFLFSYSRSNIKLYVYWKFYIENIYVDIKRLSEDVDSIFVCTKFGFSAKKIWGKKIKGQFTSPKVYTVFVNFLSFIDYVFNSIKRRLRYKILEEF